MAREAPDAFDVVFYMPLLGPVLASGGHVGGAERQIHMLAVGLAARGWKVGVVSNPTPEPFPAEVEGVRLLLHRPFGGRRRVSRRALYLSEMARMLTSLDARVVVQRSAGSTTGYVALAARLRRRRFVYSSANVIDFSFEELEPSRRTVGLFHLGIRLATEIVVQTPEQVQLCRARFSREAILIKSLAERQPLREAEPEAFLWIGRLAHYKRPEVFVELADALPEAQFRMVTVATGAAERQSLDRLRAAAAELGNLELLGALPHERVGELIARSVAVVNTAEYEGMPNIFLEGWARGVPALAFAHDPDGVIEREGLGAFAGGSQLRLVEFARQMWAERQTQERIAALCQRYIERDHAIQPVVDRWENVLGLRDATPR